MQWIIPGLIAVAVVYVIGLYNGLVTLRQRVHNAWSQIEVQLRRRFDLIPNLVETVKGYAAHESEVFERVTHARAQVASAHGVEEQIQAQTVLGGALRGLLAVAENYPQLQASGNFKELQAELATTEGKIAYARQFYNDTVMKYVTRIQRFPANLLASSLGFESMPYYQVEDEAARGPVQVKF